MLALLRIDRNMNYMASYAYYRRFFLKQCWEGFEWIRLYLHCHYKIYANTLSVKRNITSSGRCSIKSTLSKLIIFGHK